MASIFEYLGESHESWDRWSFTQRRTLKVTEVWADKITGIVGTSSEYKSLLAIKDAHRKCKTLSSVAGTSDRQTLHVIHVTRRVQQQIFDVDEDLFYSIHSLLEHQPARNLCKSILSGVGGIHESQDVCLGYISFHPKISMTWSHSTKSKCTWIICLAEEEKLKMMQDLANQEFLRRSCGHASWPVLLCGTIFSCEIDKTQDSVKKQVRHVEVRTGYHDWKSRAEAPALGDLTNLTVQMSGSRTRIASCKRKQSTLEHLLSYMERRWPTIDDEQSVGCIAETFRAVKQRAAAQQIDTKFIMLRVQNQLEALHYLIAQNDALSAQEMSQDTRLLAIAAQKDSSSMKGIAVVTMFFLPGTFVASLMSIPLFDFGASPAEDGFKKKVWRPRLIIFIAITFPLMAATFASWGFWMFYQRIKERKQATAAKSMLMQSMAEDESKRLTSKRRSLTGSSD